MTKRDEMDTQTLEDAAKAAFKQAQNVYRLNYDHFPLKNTWESVDESIRDGWRKIVSAALRVGAPPLDEYEVAEALAPYFEEGFTPRDGARAVMMLIGKRLSAQAEPGYVVKPLEWSHENATAHVPETWRAKSIGREYDIQRTGDGLFDLWADTGTALSVADTLNAAKAAAQADYEQRILSAISALPAPATSSAGWQPIETAPKDHFPVFVWSEKSGRCVAFRDVTWKWWPCPAWEELGDTPTHWMPLPAAPTKRNAT